MLGSCQSNVERGGRAPGSIPHHCAVYLGALLIGELHAKDAAGMLVSASRGDELS